MILALKFVRYDFPQPDNLKLELNTKTSVSVCIYGWACLICLMTCQPHFII